MAMQLHYGTTPDRLRAVVGPGISLANFEVGQEVYDPVPYTHRTPPTRLRV